MARLAHVGIAVRNIEEALPGYTDGLGLRDVRVEEYPHMRLRIAFVTLETGELELLEPLDDTSGVAKFLANRGEGIHHLCLRVPDVQASLDQAAAAGMELIDKEPRRGAHGQIAFIHPKSLHGVLVELLQEGSGGE